MALKQKLWVAAGLGLMLASPAAAVDFNSGYTDINLDDCTVMQADDFGASWGCPGLKGMPVWITEGDLRFMVSYGFGAPDESAAGQTPPPFNTLGPKIEWRLSNREGGWKPFATIVRYFVQRGDGADGTPDGQVLVVTKIEPGNTCHIAYIDALANSDANELARQAADETAFDFDCAKEPEIIGKFEAWAL